MISYEIIRKPAVSGLFYPASADALLTILKHLFDEIPKKSPITGLRALIAPHAGYVYSGLTAATAFSELDAESDFDKIFLIGTSHQEQFKGVATTDFHSFATPLSMVACDREVANELATDRLFSFNPRAHDSEHSLEVMLPFLQYRLKKPFRIVPLLLGTDDQDVCEAVALRLKTWFNNKNLFVISTDFSHYPDAATAWQVDAVTADMVARGDAEKLYNWLHDVKKENHKELQTAMCGAGAVMTLLNLCKKDQSIQIAPLHYSHSGMAANKDKSRVVGYQAMRVVVNHPLTLLSQTSKTWLLKLARNSIEKQLTGEEYYLNESDAPKDVTRRLGAFVSVYVNGKLRGCIGRFEPDVPLWKLIEELARSAAFTDKRFNVLKTNELTLLEIEISVLTPLRRIHQSKEFEPGKHGIYIKKGSNTGTFLPQVAESTGWSRKEMLENCSEQKAGLRPDGWKSAELYVYEAIIFSSNEEQT